MREVKLLIVGDADSIFIYNYVKALKKQTDFYIAVYSPIGNRHNYEEYPYDEVIFDKYFDSFVSRLPFFARRLQMFFVRKHFTEYLKTVDDNYDIIHFHWILPCWVINSKEYRRYAKCVGASLWGGELESLRVYGSKRLYHKKLGVFFKNMNFLVNDMLTNEIKIEYPFVQTIFNCASYGSSIIEKFSSIEINENDFYEHYGINKSKVTVMVGYSGKTIHRHCEILSRIMEHPKFAIYKETIHFVVSMSRGATEKYINKVKQSLLSTGCTYTLIDGYQNDSDVALLRKSTKVVFQLSDTDALSASIKEILSAGSFLICGNWFSQYQILKNIGFKYLEVPSLEVGIDGFYNYLDDPKEGEMWSISNKQIGRKQFLWDECIKIWISIYKHFLEELYE